MSNFVFQGLTAHNFVKMDKPSAPAIEIPDAVKVWQIGQDAANIRSWNNYQNNRGYSLFCRTNGNFLTWVEVPIGINLNYVGENEVVARGRKIHFRLPDGRERDILSGESVAFGIGMGEAFLKYEERPLGINLKWSADPVFQWRIVGPGAFGTPIPENTPVAIVNDKVGAGPDFLVYFNREPGTGSDVGWMSSKSYWDQFGALVDKHKADIAKAAIVALI